MRAISTSLGIFILVVGVLAPGCAKEQESANAATAGSAAAPARVPAAAPVERFETFIIPTGTTIVASLNTRLDTDTSQSGNAFRATTTEPIMVGSRTVVPAGAVIKGVLRDVESSGSSRAKMTLVYVSLDDAQGKAQTISALPLMLEAASSTGSDVEKIAAGAVLGGVIGAIAGGGKGAAIGAGAGAGAGVIVMLATKGDDLELDPGQKLALHMTAPLSVEVLKR